jgi:hypothetical protein
MSNEQKSAIEFNEMSRHDQSLEALTSVLHGAKRSGGSPVEHSLSIRLDIYNYPRVKTLSELSGSSMNQIINDMLDVAYATTLSAMNEADATALKQHVQATSHNWLREQEKKK